MEVHVLNTRKEMGNAARKMEDEKIIELLSEKDSMWMIFAAAPSQNEVELDEMCRQQQLNDGCFASLAAVPIQAITLTIPALMNGNFLFCVVPGKTKREDVAKKLHGPISTECPATILRKHPHCHLYLDAASASK